jgi:hypothetical protein
MMERAWRKNRHWAVAVAGVWELSYGCESYGVASLSVKNTPDSQSADSPTSVPAKDPLSKEGLPSLPPGTKGSSPSTSVSKGSALGVLPSMDRVETVIVQGDEVDLVITSSSDPKADVNCPVFLSRSGRALVIDARRGSTKEVKGNISFPASMRIRIQGGNVHLKGQNIQNDLDIESGVLSVQAQGVQNFRASCGQADVTIRQMKKDFALSCGQGKVFVSYAPFSSEKKRGLTFSRAASALIRMASGEAKFEFARSTQVFYRKKSSGIQSDIPPSYKNFDIKIFSYLPPESARLVVGYAPEQKENKASSRPAR